MHQLGCGCRLYSRGYQACIVVANILRLKFNNVNFNFILKLTYVLQAYKFN